MTELKEQVRYIMQGLIEQGTFEYFNDEKGRLCLRKGKNFGKEMPFPKTIAGKKIKWIDDRK